MEQILEILQRLLHVQVEQTDLRILHMLPNAIRNVFEVQAYKVEDMDIIFARPKTQLSFPALKKQWRQLMEFTRLHCVLYLDESTRYGRERMIELEMPFVVGMDNLYLPFLGVVLRKKRAALAPRITKFTPIAQKMILMAFYENWKEVSCREISEKLNVSRMTASRNLLELQALNLPLVETRKGAKFFVSKGKKKQLFDLCRPYFDTPIAKVCFLEEIPHGMNCLGGRSAVSRYSMLTDHPYPTYALTREEYKTLGLDKYPDCDMEDAACVVQVLRYKIQTEKTIDPISAILCMTESEKINPREEAYLRKLLDSILKE